jgi:hypothetical protein
MKKSEIGKSFELLQKLMDNKSPLLYQMINSKKKTDITETVAKEHSYEFVKLINNFADNHNIEQCLKLFDYIGVDPVKFVGKGRSKFRIDLYNRPIEDLQCFLNFAKDKVDGDKIKFPFEVIAATTYNCAFNLLSIWSDPDDKNLDNFRLLWNHENPYLRFGILSMGKTEDNKEFSTLDLFKNLKPNDVKNSVDDYYKFTHHYFTEKDKEHMIEMAFYIDLETDLAKSTNQDKKRHKL